MHKSAQKKIFKYQKNATIKDVVEQAVKEKVSLKNANLKNADLRGANNSHLLKSVLKSYHLTMLALLSNTTVSFCLNNNQNSMV